MKSERGNCAEIGVIILMVAVLLLSILGAIVKIDTMYSNERVGVFTVEKSFIDRGDLHYVLKDTNTGSTATYSNEDRLLCGKTNSADIAAILEVGKTYRLKIIGYRLSFLSTFPNILSIEDILD